MAHRNKTISRLGARERNRREKLHEAPFDTVRGGIFTRLPRAHEWGGGLDLTILLL
jgi:hypothetical protein